MSDTKLTTKSGFWDSVNRDRLYSADDMSQPYKSILTDGIFKGGFAVTSPSGLTVTVAAGRALLAGKWVDSLEQTITVPDNPTIYQRKDSVILQIDANTDVRAASIVYRTGTPGDVLPPPDLINSGGITEVRLADVWIGPSASSIPAANIHDARGGNECPYAILSEEVTDEQIAADVTAWLAANVNPVGSAVVVDTSLTIAGAAADAKVTGDAIADLNNDLSEIYDDVTGINKIRNIVPCTEGSNVSRNDSWRSINISNGDKYRILVSSNAVQANATVAYYLSTDGGTTYDDAVTVVNGTVSDLKTSSKDYNAIALYVGDAKVIATGSIEVIVLVGDVSQSIASQIANIENEINVNDKKVDIDSKWLYDIYGSYTDDLLDV